MKNRIMVNPPRALSAFVVCLGLSLAQDVACQESLVIEHATVIDMTGHAPRKDQTVIVQNKRIAYIGPARDLTLPANAPIINGKGKFLIPGLWDAHVHLAKAGETALSLFLANGITSVRDMGGDPVPVLQWRKQVASGNRIGPRIKTPGPILEDTANVSRMIREGTVEPVAKSRVGVADSSQAIAVVDSLCKLGVDFLKVRSVSSPELYQILAEAARKAGLALTGHAVVPLQMLIEGGQRSIEHAFFPPLTEKMGRSERLWLFKEMARRKLYVVPTLITGKSLQVGYKRALAIAKDSSGELDHRRKYISRYLIDDWMEQIDELRQFPANLDQILEGRVRDLREMHAAGVRFLTGTDVAVMLIYPGYSLHDELELLVKEIGLTPMEAMMAATRYPAEFFSMENDLGTLETGRIADLLILEANPLENIGNTRNIAGVVVNGAYLSKDALKQLLKTTEKGEPLCPIEVGYPK